MTETETDATGQSEMEPRDRRGALREVVGYFLRLGFTAFGGPAAHIAMMRDEVVRRRRWISDQRFLDLLGVINLIPGPNSTELAIYLGYERAGWLGLVAAGVCFIGPAMLIVLALAWAYVTYGATPQVGWLLYGIKPVVIAIILQALWGLARTALKGPIGAVIAVAVAALYLLTGATLPLLFGGALVYGLARLIHSRWRSGGTAAAGALAAPGLSLLGWLRSGLTRLTGSSLATRLATSANYLGATAVATTPITLPALFLTFLKIGALLYGSGYVLLAFLRTDFVRQLGWLSDRQLLDAVAIGQFTPGPLFTTATFVGYLVAGVPGALVATLGIFLPSFVYIALFWPVASWLRRAAWSATLLDGLNIAALALMAGVGIQLGRAALIDVVTIALAILSLFILLRWKINSAWLILGGGLIGLAAHLTGLA
ncbi:MAG TPA: chromate efflux transporter [Ktedonobacterales bacterium]